MSQNLPEEEKMSQNMQASSSDSQNLEVNKRDNSNTSPTNTDDEFDFIQVVVPPGNMFAKHSAAAPYYMFYTTITAAKDTHRQPYSITFLEILDRSLGELKCSLQINFVVESAWLLAQYIFAGYSEKKLTILYGYEEPDLVNITQKKPNIFAYFIKPTMGINHTKMMVLCYEDLSVRIVISTANLYFEDWGNRTQALWFSPRCPPLLPGSAPSQGESPTMFKRSLIKYLKQYNVGVDYYVKAVQKCDFSHINVFLVASSPGSHFGTEWGMSRVATLLRKYCEIPAGETSEWPLIAQSSAIGNYGKEPNLWLTGNFLHRFTMIKDQSQTSTAPQSLKLVYPSLENVKQSHDGLRGGGCLPYTERVHCKQTWIKDYVYQWRAQSTCRDKAMPHIKTYTRISPDNKRAGYFLLTSGNVSGSAWGFMNKNNGPLLLKNYEAGVLFLPRFVINEDSFPLEGANRLILPYDVPPTRYTSDMSPWVADYLCDESSSSS